jgi:Family of unknown function (DUF5675)
MGDSVCQLFVQVAKLISTLFASSSNQKNQNNGGSSPSAPASDAATILTSNNVETLTIARKRTTNDAVFGEMTFRNEFICYTMENSADLVLPGTYSAQLDKSPHLGYVCPHLRVPMRDSLASGDAGIRLHIANYPTQLEGCVGLGQAIGSDYLDHSQTAFDKMMAVLPPKFSVVITEI